MPPLPPDRREFLYRDGRRHDGAGGDPLPLAAPTPPPRWRDSPYHPPPPPPPPLRDLARPSPRRTASSASTEGYYWQGAAAYERPYPDEALGYTTSRSDRYWLEEDGGDTGYKNFGRYGGGGRRGNRDMRGSYRGSPFRSYGGDLPRGHQEPPPPRRSPPRPIALPDPPVDRSAREDGEHQPLVIPWRPLRRRESRSDAADAVTVGAGPMAVAHATEAGAVAPEKKAPYQSPAVAAPPIHEEEAPRKKPRLGWGQGLAKYEKQKVLGSGDSAADGSQADAEQKADVGTPASALCASLVFEQSPAPPPSFSVPEDKSCELTGNAVTVSSKDIPGAEVLAYNGEIPNKLGQLDGDPVGSLANVLAELLQHEDCCSGDSKSLTNTSKLLLLKKSITKELEKTEFEIDSLEVELSSVNAESGNRILKGARDPSPSTEALKDPVSTEICEASSLVKEQSELTPCKISVELDADAKGAELLEVDTSPVHNLKTVSSEESVSCPGVAEAQVAGAADVAPLKPSARTEPQIDDSETHELDSCQDNANSPKADGSDVTSIRPYSYPVDNYNLVPSIIAVNCDIAKEQSDLVFKPLSADRPSLDFLVSRHLSSQRKNDLRIKEKLAIHKNRLRFKERTLTFKFKVLRHLWKEDLRLLSAWKQRPKSNKRTDQSNRTFQSGSHKQRSSIRSRLGMPAGNLNSFPTMEISEVANKMFSEFQFKRYRNFLKMPALMIDEKEKACARFVSKNGLIEDPISVEKEQSVINPWSHEEKEIFMQMLATFGKDFSKISSFLKHKTTADCVEFYYKHHKSESFREVKKLLDLRQQKQPTSNFMGTKSGKKWNPEGNAASLDMLGVASVVAAHGLDYTNRLEKSLVKSIIRTPHGSDILVADKGYLDKDSVNKIPLHERESVAVDALAGICGTLSPDGMGSCITSSADPGQKIAITRTEHALVSEVYKIFDEEGTLSDQECEIYSVDWNDEEKSMFIEAMKKYGKDFSRISSFLKSKSYEQCRIFFSKARNSLGLDIIHQHSADTLLTSYTNGGRSDTDEVCATEMDINEGRSDTEEACAAEFDSAICSTPSSLKMDIDVCASVDGTIEGHPPPGVTFEQPEIDRPNEPDVVLIDTKFEEGEIIAEDENCNVPVDHSRCEATHQESCTPIDINSSENTENIQNVENGDEVSMHGPVASSTEAVASHLEVRSNVYSVDVIQSSKVPKGICTQVSRMEGTSHHAPESALIKAGNVTPSVFLPGECGGKENVIHFSDMACVSSTRPAFTSNYQQVAPANLIPSKSKQHVTPLTPKDLMPVQFGSVPPDPNSIRFDGISSITSPFEDHGHVAVSTSGKAMSTFPAFNEQSQNLHDGLFSNIDGYQRRQNHYLASDVPAFSGSTGSGTVGISCSDQFTVTRFQNDRSSSSLSNAAAGIVWTGSSDEMPDVPLKPCFLKASAENYNQVKRPGDVKLFGKILSHQSSLQSSGSSSNVSKSKPPSPKTDKSAAGLLTNSRDHMVQSSRPADTSHLELDKQMARSYTDLDGSTSGVPFYSAKNVKLGAFAKYPQPQMQKLPSDLTGYESIPDLERRNGMELSSRHQQTEKASWLGAARILISGVSDREAVLNAQYGPGSKILGGSEDDPWKDIGSR